MPMKMKAGLVLLAALAAAPIRAEAPDTFTEVADLVEEARNEWQAPGMSVAVVVDGRLAWSRGFGVADVENDVEARPDTVYRIASISKPICATAVMQLVEKGKLSLDDPVTKHVPDFPDHGLGITLRHLLTHTSGIRHYKEG